MYKLSKYTVLVDKKINNKVVNLIFSCRSSKNIEVSNRVFHALKSGNYGQLNESIQEKLANYKVLVPENEDEYESIIKENKVTNNNQQNSDLLYVSIQPTANCQLGCYYCGQEHENHDMDIRTINLMVDRIDSKLAAWHKTLRIGWFGGEPLLAIKQMRLINDRLKEVIHSKNIRYNSQIVTNGYLLTPSIYKELTEEFNVQNIHITLDGTAKHHDNRRYTKKNKPTFNKIYRNLLDVINYRKNFPDNPPCHISIRCNVDQDNYGGVSELLELFKKDDILKDIGFNVARIHSWAQNNADENISDKEYADKEIDFMMEEMKYGRNIYPLPSRHIPSCIATRHDSEMYDAYGNIFDCSETSYASIYEGTDFILGNLANVKNSTVGRSRLNHYFDDFTNKAFRKCVECNLLPVCSPCPKTIYENGNICPPLVYNIEQRILLDYLLKRSNLKDVL